MEVGRFDMDGDVELAIIHAYIDVQKCDVGGGGGVPGELDGIAAVEAFKELGEGVGSMGPKKENVIDETQPLILWSFNLILSLSFEVHISLPQVTTDFTTVLYMRAR